MQLAVIHFHFRPGGVRRVIEAALPALLDKKGPGFDSLMLIGGEAPDKAWMKALAARLHGKSITVKTDPSLGYLAELANGVLPSCPARIRSFLGKELASFGAKDVLWAHNLGLGRNPLLCRELVRFARHSGARLVLHHHDWWFDNRWIRLGDMRAAGFRTLGSLAREFFPSDARIYHIAINQRDARLLSKEGSAPVSWLPNPVARETPVGSGLADKARRWLEKRTGHAGPVWLAPCRLLRRKNLAEALLVTRWLRPCAALVSTAGVSSDDEKEYACRLQEAAKRHGWPLHLSVLAGTSSPAPSVQALCSASEVLVFTSLQEGFGLPYIEAAAQGLPLVGRRLGNVVPDLEEIGFEFPQLYEELWIDASLYDREAEQARQMILHQRWLAQLPKAYRRLARLSSHAKEERGRVLSPFSRLTLSAQLEVLSHSAEYSWSLCAPFNPFLRQWRALASKGGLLGSPWRAQAASRLNPANYAERFAALLRRRSPKKQSLEIGMEIQDAFFRDRLGSENQYPLLWSRSE